jgi:hypothetical protein
MEYGVRLSDGPHDYNNERFVGWSANLLEGNCQQYTDLYKQETVNYIQQQVSNYLMPLSGKPVIVPDQQIREMITSVWNVESVRPANIYTKDTFNNVGTQWENSTQTPYKRIVEIVIQSITSQLRNQKEMADCNNSLSIWNSLYGDFNEAGLRAHPKIKLRERRPATMQFNMNY